jgi:hypothetical protein
VTGTLPNRLTADYVKLPYKESAGETPKDGVDQGSGRPLHLGRPDHPEWHQGTFGFRAARPHGHCELHDGGEGQGDRWMALIDHTTDFGQGHYRYHL